MNSSVAPKTKRLLTSLAVGVTLFLPITAASAAHAASQAGQGSRIVTLADSGKTLFLHRGESFLLKLGEGFDWTIKIDNRSIVRRVPNVMVVRGAQGIYRAHNAGSTKLTAVGDPLCRKATPACAAPSRLFTLKIRVR
jgi:hypothetical protein